MSDFKPLDTPPGHSWVTTEDGSKTLFNESFQEACHSTTGAKTETLLHYLKGCEVIEKIQKNSKITILEVGFGTGLGLVTTYEALHSISNDWHFLSLEIDENLVQWFHQNNISDFREANFTEHEGYKIFAGFYKNIKLTILIGDARISLKNYLKITPLKWDVIYQDAFSPKKNPILWTTEWFRLLKDYSNPETIMSTYSASSSIRKSMLSAGWNLYKGEKFGPKRTSTRAKLIGTTDPDILLQLERSPAEAFTDENVRSKIENNL